MGKKNKIVFIPAEDENSYEEFGILYPDGELIWGSNYYRGDSRTREGRKQIQQEWEDRQRNLHVSQIGKLIFIKRTVTTTFSVPTFSRLGENR